MSGNLWSVWALPDAELGSPPAHLAHGRYLDNGMIAFWQHAFKREPPGRRLALMVDNGAMFLLPPEWRSRPGAEPFARWATDDPRLYKALAEFHWRITPDDGPALGAESFAFVDALFAPALTATSATELAERLADPLFAVGPPADGATRLTLPSLPPAAPLVESAAIEAPFGWPERLLARLPDTARLVTDRHRAPGMPPPGAIFWRALDAEGWIILSRPELSEIEAARGRSSKWLQHVQGKLATPSDGLQGEALTRYASFPGTYREQSNRSVSLTLDGINVSVEGWGMPGPRGPSPLHDLRQRGIVAPG